jgi:hypothetical protein
MLKMGRSEEDIPIHDAIVQGNQRRTRKTYQRACPFVTAHSNGSPFLLLHAARRFARAHASFMRSSTVSVNGQKAFTISFELFTPRPCLRDICLST